MVDVLITGGTGMLGESMKKIYPDACFIGSRDCNLLNTSEVNGFFEDLRPKLVFHLAAKVGGVHANKKYIGEFYFENIKMNTNVLDACKTFGVQKVVSILSTCIYPDDVTYPLSEDKIHSGSPHQSNYGYAYAKRMIDVQSRAYREQYGCNFVTAVPNNIFGENDNFDLTDSHVIPAIIRKVWESKLTGNPVELWGDGAPLREFTYSTDIARALKVVMEKYNNPEPINIGNTREVTIKYLAEKIAENLGNNNDIIWNNDMPSGQYRKPSSNKKFMKLENFKYTNFEESLKSVCNWFCKNYPNVRGVNN